MIKNKIGIMSGRLSKPIDNHTQHFPFKTWETEFERATLCGFDTIEWVFDDPNYNPINKMDEIKKIEKLSQENNVEVNSMCADYFIKNKIFDNLHDSIKKNLGILNSLIKNCSIVGIKILEIPLVDNSSLRNIKSENELVLNLQNILDVAEKNSITIALETDLEPKHFLNLINKFDNPYVMANYDVGNSTSLEHHIGDELEILSSKIVNIHVKDRIINGVTVPFGKGNVDFDFFFKKLNQIKYSGELIIQGAREDLNNNQINPFDTCKKYLNFVKNHCEKYTL